MTKFLRDFITSFSSYISAIRFVENNKMWPIIVGAAFFNLFAFIFVGIIAWIYTGNLTDWLNTLITLPEAYQDWEKPLQIVTIILIRILLVLAYINLFKYIILLIFAPVLAYLSEKTQNLLHQEKRELKLHHIVRDVVRGMFVAVILISLQAASWLLLILLCFSLPILAPFYAVILFLLESFFFGASMVDYRNEYFKLPVKKSIAKIFEHKGIAFGNGLALNLLILIPVLGVLFGPSIAIIAAAIASNKIIN